MAVKKPAKTKVEGRREKTGGLFSKEQLLCSARFQDSRDIVNALLRPEKEYGVEEVEQMIADYRKGQVG